MWNYNYNYNYNCGYSSDLYHHGVKGMKWGVRRYQNKDGSLIKSAKKSDSLNSTDKVKNFVTSMAHKSVATGSLFDDPAAASIVGASLVGAYIGLIALSLKASEKTYVIEKKQELKSRNRKKELKSFDDVPKLSKKMSPSESMKYINPDVHDDPTENCTFCTVAMALREKGYRVKADKVEDGWYSRDLFESTFNSKTIDIRKKGSGENVLNALQQNGEGAYGNISVKWKNGGGHSVFWKNINQKTHIYDAQSGTEIKNPMDLMKKVSNKIEYNRLDDCTPTEYSLAVVKSSDR